MKFGVPLARVRPDLWNDVVDAAEALGYESLWHSDHLVFPTQMAGSPHDVESGDDAHPPVPPETPIYEPGALLAHVAARTERIRLGTFVYLLAIRHPFVAARTFATLDVISNGRVEVGVGAGWLRSEWVAAGYDPSTRGRRLDESIGVCRRLWSEPTIAHDGEFWQWDEVAFEPKPVQERLPVLVGGESPAALRRAARLGDGWIGMVHQVDEAADWAGRVRAAEDAVGRTGPAVEITMGGTVADDADLDAYERAGVDRIIVAPWTRSRDAVDALGEFARRYLD